MSINEKIESNKMKCEPRVRRNEPVKGGLGVRTKNFSVKSYKGEKKKKEAKKALYMVQLLIRGKSEKGTLCFKKK